MEVRKKKRNQNKYQKQRKEEGNWTLFTDGMSICAENLKEIYMTATRINM